MASVINTNLPSLNVQRNLSTSQVTLATAMQRLSSGLRVNSAKDDAAGLAIGNRMDAQARGMSVAIRNANDGISLAQTAEGAMATVGDMLQRMRELAVQSANGTYSSGDRANLDAEYQALKTNITNVGTQTKFNGLAILGANAGAQTFQVGANVGDTLAVTTTSLSTTVGTIGSITSVTNANTEITAMDTALGALNTARAQLGAAQNQMSFAINNLQVGQENQTASRSRIMDADFAAETASLTRSQILQQAGTAMLAQANQIPNNVLTLLR